MIGIAAIVLFAIQRWAAAVMMLQKMVVLLMMMVVVVTGNHTLDFHIVLGADHVWAENAVGHDVWRVLWAALRRCHYRLGVVHVVAIRARLINHVLHVFLAVIIVVGDDMVGRAGGYRRWELLAVRHWRQTLVNRRNAVIVHRDRWRCGLFDATKDRHR